MPVIFDHLKYSDRKIKKEVTVQNMEGHNLLSFSLEKPSLCNQGLTWHLDHAKPAGITTEIATARQLQDQLPKFS